MSGIGKTIDSLLNMPTDFLDNPGRETATAAWQMWIKSATGKQADVKRFENVK